MAQYHHVPEGARRIDIPDPRGGRRFRGYSLPDAPTIHLRNERTGHLEEIPKADLIGEADWQQLQRLRALQQRTGWSDAEMERFLAYADSTPAEVADTLPYGLDGPDLTETLPDGSTADPGPVAV